MNFKDHFSSVSQAYRKYRPGYPEQLFSFLAFITSMHERAWDCATGTGQSAKQLAQFFTEVIATDASQSQIDKAERALSIKYYVATAEDSKIESSSIDLICVAQALHWFDTTKFFTEADRVLKPGGVLAAWCYDLLKIQPEIDAIIGEFYGTTLEAYWPQERKLVAERYQSIQLPFQEIQCPSFKMTEHWNLHQLIGYINTWSAVSIYEQQHGENPLVPFYDKIARLWGDSAKRYEVCWTITLKACIKAVKAR